MAYEYDINRPLFHNKIPIQIRTQQISEDRISQNSHRLDNLNIHLQCHVHTRAQKSPLRLRPNKQNLCHHRWQLQVLRERFRLLYTPCHCGHHILIHHVVTEATNGQKKIISHGRWSAEKQNL